MTNVKKPKHATVICQNARDTNKCFMWNRHHKRRYDVLPPKKLVSGEKHGFADHKSAQKTPSAPNGIYNHSNNVKYVSNSVKYVYTASNVSQTTSNASRKCQKPRAASKCVAKYAKSPEQRLNALRNMPKALNSAQMRYEICQKLQTTSRCVAKDAESSDERR